MIRERETPWLQAVLSWVHDVRIALGEHSSPGPTTSAQKRLSGLVRRLRRGLIFP